ncbi:hypothetical protein K435DRAFT_804794 [Dendrothele bispora CBS 962.96]|uniref:Uncharacterized protein n=1 Tax=Dendrothele bispora (strain CBS 962.96) TaxID=1314807 RepID=A0A4S8LD55_DENBC|nr:hypothetical protein K435DRAFT_804794 [Dendrothele bispora CBS 962.96]
MPSKQMNSVIVWNYDECQEDKFNMLEQIRFAQVYTDILALTDELFRDYGNIYYDKYSSKPVQSAKPSPEELVDISRVSRLGNSFQFAIWCLRRDRTRQMGMHKHVSAYTL